MAVAIVATVGSASANSFITLAEAATYMESRLNGSTWETDASTDTKNRALVEATRVLSLLPWQGTRVDTTQVLSWPRSWAPNPDVTWFAWNYFETTVIPQRVKDATAELAFQFVKSGTTDVAAADSNAGVVEKTVDVLTTRWDGWARPAAMQERYPSVWRHIGALLGSVAGNATRVVRA